MCRRLKRALVVATLAVASLGCVVVEGDRYRVTPSFTVHVSNGLGPVAGLTLRATRPKDVDLTGLIPDELRAKLTNEHVVRIEDSVTDANGDAHFDLDRPGHWYVQPSNSAAGFDTTLSVYADPHFEIRTVDLQWPSGFLETKQLHGRMSDGLMHSRSRPLKQTPVTLHNFISLAVLATTTTGDDGSFQFDVVAQGVYFLGLNAKDGPGTTYPGGTHPHGYIPVYIHDGSPRESLSIVMDETDCGLFYDLEENEPRHKPHGCFTANGPCP